MTKDSGPGKETVVVFRGGPLDGHRRKVKGNAVHVGCLLDVTFDDKPPITYRVVSIETGGYVVADYEETDAKSS